MANHVTQAERDELRRTAENYTVLAGDGSIVDFDASARRLAGDTGVSFERARNTDPGDVGERLASLDSWLLNHEERIARLEREREHRR